MRDTVQTGKAESEKETIAGDDKRSQVARRLSLVTAVHDQRVRRLGRFQVYGLGCGQ